MVGRSDIGKDVDGTFEIEGIPVNLSELKDSLVDVLTPGIEDAADVTPALSSDIPIKGGHLTLVSADEYDLDTDEGLDAMTDEIMRSFARAGVPVKGDYGDT